MRLYLWNNNIHLFLSRKYMTIRNLLAKWAENYGKVTWRDYLQYFTTAIFTGAVHVNTFIRKGQIFLKHVFAFVVWQLNNIRFRGQVCYNLEIKLYISFSHMGNKRYTVIFIEKFGLLYILFTFFLSKINCKMSTCLRPCSTWVHFEDLAVYGLIQE